ncbi:MAG: hypothetical protein FWF65_09635 [Bacteroidetes bacterium]|nr:hypothetical protein [Bacteroidota bacterium]
MITKHYGKNYSIYKLREMCSATRAGRRVASVTRHDCHTAKTLSNVHH